MEKITLYRNMRKLYKYFPITNDYAAKFKCDEQSVLMFTPNISKDEMEKDCEIIEKWKAIVCEGYLFYTCPIFFNDPFDCALHITDEKKPTKQERKAILGALEEYCKLSKIDKERILYTDFMTQTIKDILARKGIKEEASNRVLSEIRNTIPKHKDEIGICCFSEVKDAALMWAHYAGSYSGFCIEYDFSECKDINFLKGLAKVQYEDIRPIYDDITNQKEVETKMMLTKSKSWDYEKEWRSIMLLDYDEANEKVYPIMNVSAHIKSIYLGCKISPQNRQFIIEYYKGRTDIQIYDMVISEDNFDITFQKI